MKIALLPGTFDPPTLGHLDLIHRSRSLCDQLYIGICSNFTKTEELFSREERLSLLKTVCAPFPHAKVVLIDTRVSEFAKTNQVNFLLRGLRGFSDYEYEARMAHVNKKFGGMDTMFLMTDERFKHISSTLIREFGRFQTRLHDLVPPEIEDQIFQRASLRS